MPRKKTTTKTAAKKTTARKTSNRKTKSRRTTGTKLTMKQPADFNGEISKRAYEIFLEKGGHHGDDLADWFQAEKEISKKYSLA